MLLAAAALVSPAAAAIPFAPGPPLSASPFLDTKLALSEVTWTGTRFVYVEETSGQMATSAPDGSGLAPFATLPKEVEEFRCRVAPAGHGFTAGNLFCHAPGNAIYEITPDGKVSVFAQLPDSTVSDGAIAFDTYGRFDYALLVATGRSGNTQPGGSVYAVRPNHGVSKVGSYSGPGGAENALVASSAFGIAAGYLLLTIDGQDKGGRLLAMDGQGKVATLARVSGDGLNPLVEVTTTPGGAAAPGLYLAETLTRKVWFGPAAQLRRYAGGVIVGAEQRGWLFAVLPAGRRYHVLELKTNLHQKLYNLEGATYVGG